MQAGILNFFTTYPFAIPFVVAVGFVFFIIWLFTYKSLKKDIKDLKETFIENLKPIKQELNNHVKTEIIKLREDMTKKIDDKFEKLYKLIIEQKMMWSSFLPLFSMLRLIIWRLLHKR